VFGIVEFFEPHPDLTQKENLSQLLAREQHWLDWSWSLPAGARYNFSPTAGSPLGCTHSEETRAKIRAALKRRGGSPLKGRVSPLKGRVRSPLSPEHREKFAGAGANNHRFGKTAPNAIKAYIYSLDGQLVNEYSSLQAAADWLGVTSTTISNYQKSGKPFKGLYIIRKNIL
jgi:group I intron endonuclease